VIRIAVVDDHPIVRQGLVSALDDEQDFKVVGSGADAGEALALVRRYQPDVMLLDLELPNRNGIQAIPDLLAAGHTLKVLVFTAYDTDERVLRAIEAGAKGYLLKGATITELALAIRAVAAGESALAPRVAAKLVSAMRSPRGGQLTPRERQVLNLISQGLASKQIALSLGISERTVKFHTTSLLRKLDADNRAQAVAVAAQRGLLE
jgi:DNA-binding NarL/FixJ family response regulator